MQLVITGVTDPVYNILLIKIRKMLRILISNLVYLDIFI